MQPYVFPYIGYFQLISAVDKFIFFDDVNFITRGWINRNTILVNGKAHLFSLPLKKASQNLPITEIKLAIDQAWKKKFLRKLTYTYKKAPFYTDVYPILSTLFDTDYEYIATFNIASIKSVLSYLGLPFNYSRSSEIEYNRSLRGVDKVIDICKIEGATTYINLPGAGAMYANKIDFFLSKNVSLELLRVPEVEYKQFNKPFTPFLSILDVLMFNSADSIRIMVQEHKFQTEWKK